MKKTYVADFLVFEKIIVEIKAMKSFSDLERSQVINYLKASGIELGVLINFGGSKLEWIRLLHTS